MFNNKQKDFFELQLHEEQKKKHVFSDLASGKADYPPKVFKAEKPSSGKESHEKHAFKELLFRIAYSTAIFAILFLFLNWQSYSQILDSKMAKWRGGSQTSVLQELVDEELNKDYELIGEGASVSKISRIGKTSVFHATESPGLFKKTSRETESQEKQKLLEINRNPEEEKKNFPPLEMEIRPPDTRLIVPRLNKNVPIVQIRPENLIKRDWDSLEEDMMEALRFGIVHFPGTAMPGEHGNIALTGHSSYFPWDSGRFKDVFALLHDVQIGDNLLLYHKQKKYIYEVYDIKIVKPDEINVLEPTPDDRLTLITCTPVGTDISRLVVTGRLIKVS